MRFIVVLTVLLVASPLFAETTYYRWVDHLGKVHYSDTTPPEGVSASQTTVKDSDINTLPGNQRQVQEMQTEERARKVYRTRALDDWGRRYKVAEQALDTARARLEKAKTISEGDTVGSFLGGTRPSSDWQEQLDQAKQNLQKKQQALDQLQQEQHRRLYSN